MNETESIQIMLLMQVGASGIAKLGIQQPLTMDEILMRLLHKADIQGDEALRAKVSSMCGIAAVELLMEDKESAYHTYEELLEVMGDKHQRIKVDSLQRCVQ